MDTYTRWKGHRVLTCLIKLFPRLTTPVPNKINEETFSSNSPPPTRHRKQLENQPHFHGKLSLASQEADDHRYRRGTRILKGGNSRIGRRRENSDFRGGPLGVNKYWEILVPFTFAFSSSLPVSRSACTETEQKRDGPLRAWCAAKKKKKKRRKETNEKERERKKRTKEKEGPSTSLEDICAESGVSSRLTGDHPGQNESCTVHERRQASFSSRSFLALAIFVPVASHCPAEMRRTIDAGLTTSVRVFGRSRFRANGFYMRPLSSYTL